MIHMTQDSECAPPPAAAAAARYTQISIRTWRRPRPRSGGLAAAREVGIHAHTLPVPREERSVVAGARSPGFIRSRTVLRPVCLPLRVRPRVCPVPELRFVGTMSMYRKSVTGGLAFHAGPQSTERCVKADKHGADSRRMLRRPWRLLVAGKQFVNECARDLPGMHRLPLHQHRQQPAGQGPRRGGRRHLSDVEARHGCLLPGLNRAVRGVRLCARVHRRAARIAPVRRQPRLRQVGQPANHHAQNVHWNGLDPHRHCHRRELWAAR
jgi:hypothetical protein